MKTKITSIILLAFFFSLTLSMLSAQDATVKIIQSDKTDLTELKEELEKLNVDIDIEKILQNATESNQINVIATDEDGKVKEMQWDGEGEMPAEMKEYIQDIEIKSCDKSKSIKCSSKMKGKCSDKAIKIITTDARETPRKVQLGVMIEEVENGILILDVVENSGAAEAGLKTDDIITSLDGKAVGDTEQFIEWINLSSAGDIVTIGFEREGQTYEKEATLQKAEGIEIYLNSCQKSCAKSCEGMTKEECKNICKDKKACTKEEMEKCAEACTKAKTENRVNPMDTSNRKKLKVSNFKTFPNPTDGIINLSFEAKKKPTIVQIMDLSGKTVFKEVINDFNGSYANSIDLSNEAAGFFVINVIQNEKVKTAQINLVK